MCILYSVGARAGKEGDAAEYMIQLGIVQDVVMYHDIDPSLYQDQL